MSNMELFDFPAVDEFKTALEKYGTWPQTVWPIDYSNKITKRVKGLIGDKRNIEVRHQEINGTFGYQQGASIFNPQICSNILNMFAPKQGIVFDPFAGGGTRALLTKCFGLEYEGVEIRQDEVDAIIKRCESSGIVGGVKIVCADSRNLTDHFRDDYADFLITCPPYWNLEQYEGGEGDLSMLSDYKTFLSEMRKVVNECFRILKPGALACWVVGLHRDSEKWLTPLNHDISNLHSVAGFKLKEEIILAHKNNGAIKRVGQFEKGNKHLVRTHEYCLIFKKEKS